MCRSRLGLSAAGDSAAASVAVRCTDGSALRSAATQAWPACDTKLRWWHPLGSISCITVASSPSTLEPAS